MYSWLVAVLLLTSAANGSGGLGEVGVGKGVRWGGVGWGGGMYRLVCIRFPPRCTSAHHKLHMYTT